MSVFYYGGTKVWIEVLNSGYTQRHRLEKGQFAIRVGEPQIKLNYITAEPINIKITANQLTD